MGHLVAQYARSIRQSLDLRPFDVAVRMGLWRNLSKGTRRVERFEASGRADECFVQKLIGVLGLNQSRIQELLAEEDRQYQQWLDESVPMELVVRMIPAFYMTRRVPADLNREAAIKWALEQARSDGRRAMCLRLSRRERVWIRPGGESHRIEQVEHGTEAVPYMQIGKDRIRVRIEKN
jgi:hypothetical protein